ncbi:rna-directed dna polymerase from mobile element jockey-like [Limosa lapponica baueri]|uniref:Rna-directed dna polymerase from mobile element jockey-like n=1 Tax=Limosa lapponica baueri TaxID=1758121 RepID=A0A2I0UQ88_LIMLA|nr:rna-directed dna polymerase from mobile element jockey-like [Limosa lapponica baueri]
MDKGRAMDVIYLGFCKTFDTVPHNIFDVKLERYGFEGWTVRWIRTWAGSHIQRIIANGSMTKWELVMSNVFQGSILGPILFNIFINDIGSGIKSTLTKFTDYTKLSGAVNALEGRDAIQKEP